MIVYAHKNLQLYVIWFAASYWSTSILLLHYCHVEKVEKN